MKTQEWGLIAIIITVCLAWGGSVLASAIGRPVAADLQGVINTTFVAMAVVVPTWLAQARVEREKQEAYRAGLNHYEGLRAGK
jgi:hypothetical protein